MISRLAIVAFVVSLGWPFLGVSKADIVVELSAIMATGIVEGGYGPGGAMNYSVGYYTPPGDPPTPLLRRNYFVFNLTAVDKPVTSAKLKLHLPGPPGAVGYSSPDPFEPYRISGTPYSASEFLDAFPMGADTPSPMLSSMYESLGSAALSFGMIDVSPSMAGGDVVIPFNPTGIAAINLFAGSLMVIGGRLTDITPEMLGIPPSELVFVYSTNGGTVPFPRLELTMVPEPSSSYLLSTVVAGAVYRFRRYRRPVRA